MKVLTRYLFRSLLGPFLFAWSALTGVMLINTLARELADLAGKGLSTGVLLQFFILSLPASVALTVPMAVLVAVMYTFSQLTTENEVTALKAGGVDLRRLMIPLIAAAVIASGIMMWFNDRVLAESNHQWSRLQVDIARKSPLFILREQTVNAIRTEDGRTRYLQASRIDPTTNHLQNVVIYDVSHPRQGRTIYADSGVMAFNTSRTDLLLTLYDGSMRDVSFDEPEKFQQVDFHQQVIRIPGVGNELERRSGSGYRGDREMTIAMMQGRIDTLYSQLADEHLTASEAARSDIERLFEAPERTPAEEEPYFGVGAALTGEAAATAAELDAVQQRTSGLRQNIRELQVEVHKKYSIAAAILVFVLIGAPLAVRFPRGGIGTVIIVSLTIISISYFGLHGGETLADEGYLPPVAAMWGMNAILTIVGLLLLLGMGKEKSTARGGGWLDSLTQAFSRFRRRT